MLICMKVEISVRAAMQRINRQLLEEKVVAARTEKQRRVFGRYFVVHLTRGVVTERNVDLERYMREWLGDTLRDWEVVEKPPKAKPRPQGRGAGKGR
jgi:hypothetical protein